MNWMMMRPSPYTGLADEVQRSLLVEPKGDPTRNPGQSPQGQIGIKFG